VVIVKPRTVRVATFAAADLQLVAVFHFKFRRLGDGGLDFLGPEPDRATDNGYGRPDESH